MMAESVWRASVFILGWGEVYDIKFPAFMLIWVCFVVHDSDVTNSTASTVCFCITLWMLIKLAYKWVILMFWECSTRLNLIKNAVKLVTLKYSDNCFLFEYIFEYFSCDGKAEFSANHHIIMISEASRDTEYWSNGCWQFHGLAIKA